MFTWLTRKLNYLKLLNQRSDIHKAPKFEKIPDNIEELNQRLKDDLAQCADFVLRKLTLKKNSQENTSGDNKRSLVKKEFTISVAYIDNMTDKQILNDSIIKPLLRPELANQTGEISKKNILTILTKDILNNAEVKEVNDYNEAMYSILSGDTVVFVDGCEQALTVGTKGWESRGVDEPSTEVVIRGPREGFVEDIATNCTLIRRKIKNPNLKMERMVLGKQTHTDIRLCYIKGIVNEDILNTVRRRISRINTDAILESCYIEEFIEDAPFSLFPTVANSEKPDAVAGKILEGRVAILIDGTPFALTVPHLFIENLQASEDYYSRPIYAVPLRLLRVLTFFVTLTLPAFYIALLSFHQAVIPFKLLITITATREGVPFSPCSEALFMGLTFEILQEAGVRMPRPIGQAVSIVGALIIGEASVRAGLVSNPMVIVTGITAVSSFILPPLQRAAPVYRIIYLAAANVLGFMGIFLVMMSMVVHMCSLRSFGIPYTSPIAPLSGMDLKDSLVRMPVWTMLTRPKALTWENNGNAKFRMGLNIRKKED